MAERQDIKIGARMRLSDVLQTQNAPDEPIRMRLGDVMSLERIDIPEANETGIYQISDEQTKLWQGQGPIGYFEQAIRQDKTEMIPFNPEAAVKSIKLLNAVNRLKRNRYESDSAQEDLDINLVNRFLEKSEEERIRGFTIGGRITQGAAALPGFMIEFLLTGGIAAIGKKGIKTAIKPVAKRIAKQRILKFTTRVAGGLAGAAARTAAMPHRVVGSYAERQLNASLELTDKGLQIAEQSREKPFVSAMKAYGDVIIENFSEVTGPEISKVAGKIVPKKIADGLAKLFKKLHPARSIRTLFTKVGYHGFLEELGEERVGALLKAVTGVEDFGADNPDAMFDRIIASIPNGEEMLVEAGVLALPGAIHAGAQQTGRIIQSRKTIKRPGEVLIDEKTGEPKETPGFKGEIGDEAINEILETTEAPILPVVEAPVAPIEAIVPEVVPEVEKPIKALPKPITPKERLERLEKEKSLRKQLSLELEQEKILQSALKVFRQEPQAPAEAIEAVREELAAAGFAIESQAEIESQLRVTRKRAKFLRERIKALKPEIVPARQEIVVVRQRVKDITYGTRIGTIATKQQIKQAQTELITMIEKSGIEAKDKAKFIRAIKNTQTGAQLSKVLPEIEQRLTTLKETSESKALRTKVTKELKATKVKRVAGKPVGKFTPELQTAFDMAREVSKLTPEAVEMKIAANIEALGDDLPTPKQALENRMLSLFGGLKGKSSAELKETLAVIQDLKTKGKSESLARLEQRQAKLAEDVDASFKSVIGRKTPSKSRIKTPIERLRKTLSAPFKTVVGWNNILNLLALDDKVAPGQSELEKRAKVSTQEQIEKGARRKNIKQVVDIAMKAFGLKTNAQLVKRFRQDSEIKVLGTFRNERGEEVVLELSKAEARKRWMEFQDPSLVETLISEKGNAYSPDMIKAIEELLTQEDRAFAEAQLQFYRDFYNNTVNPVYRDIYGVNLPFNEFYSPISREHKVKTVVDEFLKDINFRRSVTTGSLKSRIANQQEIKIQSDIVTLQKHIIEMAHFVTWADKIRQLNAIFTDSEIREVINKKYGGEMQKVINDFMKDFTTGRIDQSKNFGGWDMLRVNFTRAKLAVKTSLFFKQMVSFIAFADDVPLPAFVAGIADFTAHPIRSTKTLNQSELMQARGANLTRDIRDAMASDEFSAFRQKPSFKNMLMLLVKVGDRGAILFGGWSVYKHTLKKTGSKEKAMQAFEETTSAAQQSADLSQLSIWQRGNTFQKMFTMFTSSQNQYFRKEYMAIRNLIAGKQSVRKTAKTILIYHFLLPMFFQWVSDFGKWNKDEQLRAAILGSFNGIFIIKDILDGIIREAIGLHKFDLSVATFSIVDGIFNAMNAIDIDDIMAEDVLYALGELSETVGGLTGLPLEQVKNWVEAVGNIYEDEKFRGALRLLGWTNYVIDNNLE